MFVNYFSPTIASVILDGHQFFLKSDSALNVFLKKSIFAVKNI
jgi:hypothetical protein